MEDIENIKGILTKYNTTLQSCIERISENNKVNKKMAEEIQNKVNLIKGRVSLARDNVEDIGKQQTDFYNTMEREKGKIREQQEKRMGESKKEQERLQNKLKESQNQSATRIQELQAQQEKKIQDLKDQAALEANEAKEKQKAEDEDKLQMKMEELNKKMEDANSVAAENAAKIQKEAREAKEKADNERATQEQRLLELEQQRQAIFERDTACEEQLEKLKGNIAEMKGEIDKMKGEIDTLTTQNSEDKKAAALTLEAKITELALTHKGEMEAQLNKSADEKKQYMDETAATHGEAIKKAVEEVKEANLLHQKQIEEATMTEKGNLEAQLAQCKQSKKAYEKEVNDHLEKYKELEKQFENSKNDALDGLKELVDELGEVEIASLEKTIQDILDKKGPDETGTGGIGTRSPLERQDSSEAAASTVRMADSEIRRSQSLLDNKLTGQEAVVQLDEEKEMEQLRRETADRKKKREERRKRHQELVSDTEEEQQDFAKTTQKKEPGAKQAWVEEKIDKTKYSSSHKDNAATKELLLKDVETFISGIDSQEKMTKLINNVIQNHGIHNTKKPKYHEELARFKGDNYKKIRQIYKKALVGIIEGGLKKEIYVEIIDKIKETTVEEVFEELLAAFHLVYSTDKIGNVYSMGDQVIRGYKDSDYIRNGEVAAYIWKPRGDEWFDDKMLIKNGKANGDRKMEQMVVPKMHDYIHSHDIKKLASTGQGGGFRHGKRSQKKNKRTLKSKLTAKKYSLKVGKKKRGEKGNKSQKRRKSIKIRI